MKVYELINELQCFTGGEEVFCLQGAEGPVLTVAGEPAIDLPSAGVDLVPADEAAGVDQLGAIVFASDAAKEKAYGSGLQGSDFDGLEPTGSGGFTVADVEVVVDAVAELEGEAGGESADSEEDQGEEAE